MRSKFCRSFSATIEPRARMMRSFYPCAQSHLDVRLWVTTLWVLMQWGHSVDDEWVMPEDIEVPDIISISNIQLFSKPTTN